MLAFHTYCQIPFAKTKASNPDVISLAELLGRTPSSVARKLGNFGAFDPMLAEKGISASGMWEGQTGLCGMSSMGIGIHLYEKANASESSLGQRQRRIASPRPFVFRKEIPRDEAWPSNASTKTSSAEVY